jgi:hypothetical protein
MAVPAYGNRNRWSVGDGLKLRRRRYLAFQWLPVTLLIRAKAPCRNPALPAFSDKLLVPVVCCRGEATGAVAKGLIAVSFICVVLGHGHTTMQQIQLAIFLVAVAALVVTGCILTRKPRRKGLPTETLRPMVEEHQPGCFALEEERGSSWKGRGKTVPSVKEAKPSL